MTDIDLDLDVITREFLTQCGPCDYGLVEFGCNCPTGDYRPPMSRLVDEVKRLRALLGGNTQGVMTRAEKRAEREMDE